MTDETPSGPTPFEEYGKLASTLVESYVQARSGFGALRHYAGIRRDTARLVLESSFFVHPDASPGHPWPFPDPDLFHFMLRHWGDSEFPQAFLRILQHTLNRPSSYHPHALWALFWALAKGEHAFLHRYTPFWSHEERLTGHLVSQMITCVEDFGDRWNMLSQTEGQTSACRIWYADTATARQEKVTGADLGLVVHARFSDTNEFFKVVRFQAKKVNRQSGKARIDLDQADALLQRENLGYYLFYHFLHGTNWSLPPTVTRASALRREVEQAQKDEKRQRHSLGTLLWDGWQSGYDLATFITFAVADPAVEHGVMTANPEEAIRVLTGGPPPGAPSRVLIVTLGDGASVVDWGSMLHEYIGLPFEEE